MSNRQWTFGNILENSFVQVFANMVASIRAAQTGDWPYGSWFRQQTENSQMGWRNNQMGISRDAGNEGLWVRDKLDESTVGTSRETTGIAAGLANTATSAPSVLIGACSATQWLTSVDNPLVTRSSTFNCAELGLMTLVSEKFSVTGNNTTNGQAIHSYSVPCIRIEPHNGVANNREIGSGITDGNGTASSIIAGGTW